MYDTTPQSIELREIRYVITKPGRKQDPFAIVTTMTDVDGEDAVQYEDLAKLFGFRWNAELDIRNIQDTHELEPPTLQEPGEGPQGVLGDDAGVPCDPEETGQQLQPD